MDYQRNAEVGYEIPAGARDDSPNTERIAWGSAID
jgi:hypothetical protein